MHGADVLLSGIKADAVLADKAYDADERIIEPLKAAGIEVVIPSKINRLQPRPYDHDLYKAKVNRIFFTKIISYFVQRLKSE